MVDTFEKAAQTLERNLSETGEEYRLLEKPSSRQCRVQFTGQFNHRRVVWDVCIRTLKDYANDIKRANNLSEIKLKQFIEIEQGDACYRALVVLKLGEINTAAIGPTIIMIRKYKRLHLGRHEYGDPVIF
ncbi:MAG TPA: hypothetical protein VIQ03_07915 [Gammaproteobacteria bacterium]